MWEEIERVRREALRTPLRKDSDAPLRKVVKEKHESAFRLVK